jgi:hypothetical protein
MGIGEILSKILAGGFVGYITNDIAIKMLFEEYFKTRIGDKSYSLGGLIVKKPPVVRSLQLRTKNGMAVCNCPNAIAFVITALKPPQNYSFFITKYLACLHTTKNRAVKARFWFDCLLKISFRVSNQYK